VGITAEDKGFHSVAILPRLAPTLYAIDFLSYDR
jgi:hypothetical protein